MTSMDNSTSPARLGADMQFCVGCGKPVHKTAVACPNCGARQPAANLGGRQRLPAALIAFFLGGFGGHKFYLGQTGWGIVYLLFFWTLIPAIAAFIGTLMLLTMSDENFNAKYNAKP